MSQEWKRWKPTDYHQKQLCTHRDIVSCIINDTGGKMSFVESILLGVQTDRSANFRKLWRIFFELLQGNLPEHLGRTSMFRELVCFQFQAYFQDCYEVFEHLPNHCIIGKNPHLSILGQRREMICQDLARGTLKDDTFAFKLGRKKPHHSTKLTHHISLLP